MTFFLLLVIFILVGLLFLSGLSTENTKRDLARKENELRTKREQLGKVQTTLKIQNQKLNALGTDLLDLKNTDDLHKFVEFPVVELDDGKALLITSKCLNDCVIESKSYDTYDLGIIISKILTDLGHTLEVKLCRDCEKEATQGFEENYIANETA